jgi:TolA-binding protein
MYKAIIADYPGTEEAKEALLAIKNIYVDAGNADGYLNYVKTLPFASVSSGAQDSITYQAANNRYLIGDCENAINGFNNYIERFTNGSFILEAHANRAECFIKTKKEKMALIDYEYLVAKSNPKYLERSLVQSARINFKLKEYEKAAKLYRSLETQAEFKDNYLEAISGALKSYAALNDSTGIMKYAKQVLLVEKSSIEDQYLANLFLGRLYFSLNNIEEADNYFKAVAKLTKTEYGAEAKYMVAKILFLKGKYLDAQQACFDLSNQVPAYEFWVAKGFIILAETYAKLGNDFQAKSTLESIIDEYSTENDGILEEAKMKLTELTQPK